MVFVSTLKIMTIRNVKSTVIKRQMELLCEWGRIGILETIPGRHSQKKIPEVSQKKRLEEFRKELQLESQNEYLYEFLEDACEESLKKCLGEMNSWRNRG